MIALLENSTELELDANSQRLYYCKDGHILLIHYTSSGWIVVHSLMKYVEARTTMTLPCPVLQLQAADASSQVRSGSQLSLIIMPRNIRRRII